MGFGNFNEMSFRRSLANRNRFGVPLQSTELLDTGLSLGNQLCVASHGNKEVARPFRDGMEISDLLPQLFELSFGAIVMRLVIHNLCGPRRRGFGCCFRLELLVSGLEFLVISLELLDPLLELLVSGVELLDPLIELVGGIFSSITLG